MLEDTNSLDAAQFKNLYLNAFCLWLQVLYVCLGTPAGFVSARVYKSKFMYYMMCFWLKKQSMGMSLWFLIKHSLCAS